MASPAEGVALLLETAGVGTRAATSGWSIGVGRRLQSPDTMIVVFDTPGENPNPKWLLDHPHFQVVIRGAKDAYGAAWAKAKDVKDVVLGMEPQTVNGDLWDGIIGQGDIFFLEYDDNNRPVFAANYKIFLEPATSALTKREVL